MDTTTNLTAYLAPKGFTYELLNELNQQPFKVKGRLVLTKDEPRRLSWSQNTWLNPMFIPISSINDAAKKLSTIQRNWILHSEEHHRRASLIQQNLPHVSAKKIRFGSQFPKAKLGSWTLWDSDLLLASPECSSIFPNGVVSFFENTIEPPSRAYLKLWEVWTLFSIAPEPGELCLDLGSSPGGWTWAVAQLGSRVFSIDKAKLHPNVSKLPNVESCQGSGFACLPASIGPVDWLFSDMVCYPEKLLSFIKRWIEKGSYHTIICSIKLQGTTDQKILSSFKDLPSSRVIHLSRNKRELTFIHSKKFELKLGYESSSSEE